MLNILNKVTKISLPRNETCLCIRSFFFPPFKITNFKKITIIEILQILLDNCKKKIRIFIILFYNIKIRSSTIEITYFWLFQKRNWTTMDIRDEFRLSRFYDQRKLSLLKRSTKFSIRSNLEIESLAIRRYCRERLSVFIMQFNFRANSLYQPGMLKRNWSFPPSPPPCESRKRNCYFLSNPFCGTISLDKNCVWGRLLIVWRKKERIHLLKARKGSRMK